MENGEKQKNAGTFAKYSGIAFQMLVTIGLFTYAGYRIDGYRGSDKPLFTAILGLLGVIISLYQVVRQLSDKK